MNLKKLEELLKHYKQPVFRLKQIQKAIYQDGVALFSEITTLPKDIREKLDQEFPILSFGVEQVLVAKNQRSIKALLKCTDGNLIETVLISPKAGTWSACISCQIGCPNGCGFCATGKMGFKRNLTTTEITDQALFWIQYLSKTNKLQAKSYKLSNIVYMGMGEPFLNWENVRQSLNDLTDPEIFGIGSRSIAVSTSGVPAGMRALLEEFPQVNLALSLHFATDEKRSQYMPINRKHNLAELRQTLRDYFEKSKRKVFVEYVMLAGINDSHDDARSLADYLKSIGHSYLLHINLISYNTTSIHFQSSSTDQINRFRDWLEQFGISVTIRKSLGAEIQGACGQLAGR